MEKRKKKVKNTAVSIKDNIFVPTVSLGQIALNSDIKTYLDGTSYVYEEDPKTKEDLSYDTYYFDKYDLEAWVDVNGIVVSVKSSNTCYWNGINIVGLRFEKFKSIFHMEPDNQDVCYISNGQSHHVYDFYSVGLQIWVWYGIIRTVIATRVLDD